MCVCVCQFVGTPPSWGAVGPVEASRGQSRPNGGGARCATMQRVWVRAWVGGCVRGGAERNRVDHSTGVKLDGVGHERVGVTLLHLLSLRGMTFLPSSSAVNAMDGEPLGAYLPRRRNKRRNKRRDAGGSLIGLGQHANGVGMRPEAEGRTCGEPNEFGSSATGGSCEPAPKAHDPLSYALTKSTQLRTHPFHSTALPRARVLTTSTQLHTHTHTMLL